MSGGAARAFFARWWKTRRKLLIASLLILMIGAYHLFSFLAGVFIRIPFKAGCQGDPVRGVGFRHELHFVDGPYSEEFWQELTRHFTRPDGTLIYPTKNGMLYVRLRAFWSSDGSNTHGDERAEAWAQQITTDIAYLIIQRRRAEAESLPPGTLLKLYMQAGIGQYYGYWDQGYADCRLVEAVIRKDGLLARPLAPR